MRSLKDDYYSANEKDNYVAVTVLLDQFHHSTIVDINRDINEVKLQITDWTISRKCSFDYV